MNEYTDATTENSKDSNLIDSKYLDSKDLNVALQDMVIRGLYGRGKNQPYLESPSRFERSRSFESVTENTTIDTKKRKFIDIS